MKDNKNHVTSHNSKSWSVGAKALWLWRKWKLLLRSMEMFTKDQGEEENYFGALEAKMFSSGF
jgi:hypothetical protein